MTRFAAVIRGAVKAGLRVRGYVSCSVHCPYEAWVAPTEVADLAAVLMELGCYEVSLCDTTGHIAVHFHDTKGRALDNTEACLRLGITTVDNSVAGLGGVSVFSGCGRQPSDGKTGGTARGIGNFDRRRSFHRWFGRH